MRPLETSLFRLHPSRIKVAQEEEKEFQVPGDHLKHRFLDKTEVEFWACL